MNVGRHRRLTPARWASEGGRRLFDGGGRELFARRAIACRDVRIARRAPFADTASACLAVHRELAAAVATAAAAGELPIVIAGSCDAAAGVLAGLTRGAVRRRIGRRARRLQCARLDRQRVLPRDGTGIGDAPVPRGLSLEQLDEVLDTVTGRLALGAVARTTYTPSRDVAGATHATALHGLGRIADHCATAPRR